jgi:hypothetical protein
MLISWLIQLNIVLDTSTILVTNHHIRPSETITKQANILAIAKTIQRPAWPGNTAISTRARYINNTISLVFSQHRWPIQ